MAGLFEEDYFKDVEKCWPRLHPLGFPGIRDQGKTHCCYAFPIMNCIYANMYMHKRTPLLKGSEQEMLDCLHLSYPPKSVEIKDVGIPKEGYINNFKNALKYIMEKGIITEKDYPWEGVPKECRRNRHGDHIIRIENYRKIDRELVVKELETVPAVAATVVLTQALTNWKNENHRKTGIYAHSKADKEDIKKKIEKKEARRSHGITLVGYGGKKKLENFLAANSFGKEWGYQGFFKVARDDVYGFYVPENCWIESK